MKIHTVTCEWCEGTGKQWSFRTNEFTDRECVICKGDGQYPVRLTTTLRNGTTVQTSLIKGRWQTFSDDNVDTVATFWSWTADDNLEDAKRRHNQAIGHVG